MHALIPSSKVLTYSAFKVLIPTFSIALLNFLLFSAISIDSADAPKSSMLFSLNTLFFSNSIDKFNAV